MQILISSHVHIWAYISGHIRRDVFIARDAAREDEKILMMKNIIISLPVIFQVKSPKISHCVSDVNFVGDRSRLGSDMSPPPVLGPEKLRAQTCSPMSNPRSSPPAVSAIRVWQSAGLCTRSGRRRSRRVLRARPYSSSAGDLPVATCGALRYDMRNLTRRVTRL